MHRKLYTFFGKKIGLLKIGVADLGLRIKKIGFVHNTIL
jgi:hypothetical protein